VTVSAYEGGNVIGSEVISLIAGKSQASVSFVYDTSGKNGVHEITIAVDPGNTVQSETKTTIPLQRPSLSRTQTSGSMNLIFLLTGMD